MNLAVYDISGQKVRSYEIDPADLAPEGHGYADAYAGNRRGILRPEPASATVAGGIEAGYRVFLHVENILVFIRKKPADST